MKMILMAMAVALSAAVAHAAENATQPAGATGKKIRQLTDEQREAIRRARYRKTGGMVRRPGVQKGAIGFVVLKDNRIPAAKVREVCAILEKATRLDVRCIEVPTVPRKGVAGEMRRLSIDCGVFVTWCDDCDLPMVHVPEQHWAMVNARVLKENAPSDAVYGDRVLKESARAYAYVCGAAGSTGGEGLMNVRSIAELDKVEAEFTPDVLNRMGDYTASMGITPYIEATYLKACQGGWAPQPTNDVQKAIWNSVHATPKTPMKIEFDPKKGR